jgi:hypothetical protein
MEEKVIEVDENEIVRFRIYVDRSDFEGVGVVVTLWVDGREKKMLAVKLGSSEYHTVFEVEVIRVLLAFYIIWPMDEVDKVVIGVV